jgi:hypothetical protein
MCASGLLWFAAIFNSRRNFTAKAKKSDKEEKVVVSL